MKKIKIALFAFAMVLSSVLFGRSTFAEDSKPEYKIAISPSIDDLGDLESGTQKTGSFKVYNEGTKDFEYDVSFAPYSVKTESYEPSFADENKYTDIQKWIEVDAMEGNIAAGDEKTINYTISIPEGFHGGMQSAAILVTMRNDPNQGGNINAVRQIAYIVYGNVDGDIIETGKVLENKVPSFLFNPPIIGSSTVENTGNVYTRATYKLQVFPLFSDEEVYTNEENPENNIIFPETKRYNEIKWEGSPHLGIFRVRQTVKIFDDESVVEKIVFLCPIWFLFIVILLVFLIIFWIASRIFKRKREV